MARSSGTWKAGIPCLNPGGKTLGERVAQRTIAEAFRSLADPVDIGRSLLAIYSGIDPFAKDTAPDERGMPVSGPVPIDMTHRMAALKMWLEYGFGKPLQGVVIDAQVRQETRLVEERTHVVELREVAARDPRAREAMRLLASAKLGQKPALEVKVDARKSEPVGSLANALVPAALETLAEVSVSHTQGFMSDAEDADHLEVGPLPTGELEDDSFGRGEVDAKASGVPDEVTNLHASTVAEAESGVNEKAKKPRGPGFVL